MGKNDVLLFIALMFLVSIQKICFARDTITSTEFLKDGEIIVSSGGIFELGFFSPTNSLNRYVGIWYKQIPVFTVIWVANRDNPITDSRKGFLKIINPGRLALVEGNNNSIFWHTNTSIIVQNPVAKLLDSGNLVITDANKPGDFQWQSFRYPTDTLMPDMMFGKNFLTGFEISMSSWKTENNPGTGEYTFSVEPTGYPQVVIKNGEKEVLRSGPWNGFDWNGTPGMDELGSFAEISCIANATDFLVNYSVFNSSKNLVRAIISSSGNLQFFLWTEGSEKWNILFTAPTDICDRYGYCGAYGICYYDNYPSCSCLDKFLPKKSGCVRRTPLSCQNGSSSDGFVKYNGLKFPDTKFSWFNSSMNLQECEKVCFKNCNCTAYSSLNISNGEHGCLLWFGDLMDIRVVPEKGQDIFIRMAASDIDYTSSSKQSKKLSIIRVSSSLLILVLALSSTAIMIFYKRKRKNMKPVQSELLLVEDQTLFEASTITKATDNFSARNKVGEGGYGPVYKGVLDDGREIAVKRLSKTSTQGLEEFKNEVNFIAKLQHRNLVNLLGWCIKGEEKMLIYEYMPNKSLDSFIFDCTGGRTLLDWTKRFDIISGIARGLLYLHQDSRLRIIHRDLKASNILLDIDMNPKISDFGLARSIGGNETGANTCRVAGTHGYMSPEYAANGMFSTKSDVFSFGVSVLEIVSGKRNRGFSNQDYYENLPSYAWKLYRDGRSIELLDEHLVESCNLPQVLRSIHVGLLCVQQHPEDRPSMYSVVQMLSNDAELHIAKEPGFFTGRAMLPQISTAEMADSVNEVTVSLLNPR